MSHIGPGQHKWTSGLPGARWRALNHGPSAAYSQSTDRLQIHKLAAIRTNLGPIPGGRSRHRVMAGLGRLICTLTDQMDHLVHSGSAVHWPQLYSAKCTPVPLESGCNLQMLVISLACQLHLDARDALWGLSVWSLASQHNQAAKRVCSGHRQYIALIIIGLFY